MRTHHNSTASAVHIAVVAFDGNADKQESMANTYLDPSTAFRAIYRSFRAGCRVENPACFSSVVDEYTTLVPYIAALRSSVATRDNKVLFTSHVLALWRRLKSFGPTAGVG